MCSYTHSYSHICTHMYAICIFIQINFFRISRYSVDKILQVFFLEMYMYAQTNPYLYTYNVYIHTHTYHIRVCTSFYVCVRACGCMCVCDSLNEFLSSNINHNTFFLNLVQCNFINILFVTLVTFTT